MIGLIGRKLGMTRVFTKDDKMVPVTIIQAGPCRVVQRKTKEKDGYDSAQMGFDKIKKCRKPLQGHFSKRKSSIYRHLVEFRLTRYKDVEQGEDFGSEIFIENELVNVVGTSKGKGFQGVMKRHNFKGFIATHGTHESFRGPGSIGQCATPSRVFKGRKMAGHMGNQRVTVQNLQIIKIVKEKNLIFVKGAVPGHRNSIVLLKKEQ